MDSDTPRFNPPSPGDFSLRYIQYAQSLLESYKGEEPFHLYLKKYFGRQKKHGSRDRRFISSLCYAFFRVGAGCRSDLAFEEKILVATFLCENNPSLILGALRPAWNEMVRSSMEEKLALLSQEFSIAKLFRFPGELSGQVDLRGFSMSFLRQPHLFLRIRPGHQAEVLRKLKDASLPYYTVGSCTVALEGNPRVEDWIDLDREAVVQDLNSQRTLDALKDLIVPGGPGKFSVWDCCAGSGGKSILAFDLVENTDITVTDKREGILRNLSLRFSRAGITSFHVIPCDLEAQDPDLKKIVDLVIADVPCSGSGTWARTPEQHFYFDPEQISEYVVRQRKILNHVLPFLKSNGFLVYITCSVFEKENEENVEYLMTHFSLQHLHSQYLKGYDEKADTMFVAVFQKK